MVGALSSRLVCGVLRVEDAQGIRAEATLRVGAERLLLRRQHLDEGLLVPCTRLRAADGIDEHVRLGDPDVDEEAYERVDHLRVAAGSRVAEALGAHLVELAVAALRGTLAAEHRAEVIPARDRLVVVDLVLDVRAGGAGRALGTERERLVVEDERVHLLLDDVGGLADGPHEQRGRLHVRSADLAIAKALHRRTERPFDPVPSADLAGKHVIHAFNGTDEGRGRHGGALIACSGHRVKHRMILGNQSPSAWLEEPRVASARLPALPVASTPPSVLQSRP